MRTSPSRSGWRCLPCGLAIILLSAAPASAWQDMGEGDVVFGPTKNAKLQDGASALDAGKAEKGIELTLEGLKAARGTAERRTALSNLCAGYLMLDELDKALFYCNEALELNEQNWRIYNNRALIYVLQRRFPEAEADLAMCDELHPAARPTKIVRQLLVHAKNPVAPIITVDDRRTVPMAETVDELEQ